MNWLKRISLFILINLLIVSTISFILSVFHIGPYLTSRGLDVKTLLIFCTVWGMGGAFISLLMSKYVAKWAMGVHVFDRASTPEEQHLLDTITRHARQLGLPTPQVGIFESEAPNAFATGPSRSSSLVAVSRGLLNRLNTNELEAVIGHEMSHIANGDMVTMTLLQGIINAFVMFLARALAYFFASGRDRSGRSSAGMYYVFTFLFEIVFMLLGSVLLCSFSRYREYHADKGGADLAGRDNMISALRALDNVNSEQKEPQACAALMIREVKGTSLLTIFSTHPSIEKRIERLMQR